MTDKGGGQEIEGLSKKEKGFGHGQQCGDCWGYRTLMVMKKYNKD